MSRLKEVPDVLVLFLYIFLACVSLQAQNLSPSNPGPRKLADLIPGFVEDNLQNIDPAIRTSLGPVVNSTINLASINSSVATALSNLPIPSPASGFRYAFDPSQGVYVPSVQSLGPILTERGETIGKEKFFFAVTYQRFQFDRLDQVDLRHFSFRIPLNLQLAGLPPIQTIIDSNSSISLIVNETTAHFTYGVTHWLDASYSFPIVTSTLSFSTQDSIAVPALGTVNVRASLAGSATGLGDGVARVKAKLLEHKGLTVAAAGDIRIPTGDEFNYHGAGAYGVKPFLIASFNRKYLSPHINAGYQWNGKSFLGSSNGMEKERLPGQLFYAAGAEASLSPRATISFDLLDQIVIHGRRSFIKTEEIAGTMYTTAYYPNQSRHEVNGAAGFKARLGHDVVLTGNLLFRLNDSGLRTRVVPLLGLSYFF